MHAMPSSASEHSYAQNSSTQNYGFHVVAKPRLRTALKHLLCIKPGSIDDAPIPDREASAGAVSVHPRRHIAIADLGCSHGRNTLDWAEFIVPALLEDHVSSAVAMEVQYFFSDLPSNDFNALFQSLQPYLIQQSDDSGVANLRPKFFAAGVPGSFYGRLFVKASLDLIISSFSLHWLSQVPPGLVDKASPSWNGGHTWMSNAEPSKAVADAYSRQFERDVQRFLRCRAEELASGGVLFLLWVAKSSCSLTEGTSDCLPFERTLEFLDYAWKEMVDEGLIAAEEMDLFNIGLYFFKEEELESAVKEVPELRVLQLETIRDFPLFPDRAAAGGGRSERVKEWGAFVASLLVGAVEAQVGRSRADELFKRLKSIALRLDCFDARLTHTLVVASLQRL